MRSEKNKKGKQGKVSSSAALNSIRKKIKVTRSCYGRNGCCCFFFLFFCFVFLVFSLRLDIFLWVDDKIVVGLVVVFAAQKKIEINTQMETKVDRIQLGMMIVAKSSSKNTTAPPPHSPPMLMTSTWFRNEKIIKVNVVGVTSSLLNNRRPSSRLWRWKNVGIEPNENHTHTYKQIADHRVSDWTNRKRPDRVAPRRPIAAAAAVTRSSEYFVDSCQWPLPHMIWMPR